MSAILRPCLCLGAPGSSAWCLWLLFWIGLWKVTTAVETSLPFQKLWTKLFLWDRAELPESQKSLHQSWQAQTTDTFSYRRPPALVMAWAQPQKGRRGAHIFFSLVFDATCPVTPTCSSLPLLLGGTHHFCTAPIANYSGFYLLQILDPDRAKHPSAQMTCANSF